jgi:Tfp pilus assembly protein PilO
MDIRNLSKIDVATLARNKNLLANLGIIVIALIITRNLHLSQINKINILKEEISHEAKIAEFVDELSNLEDKIEELEKDFDINLSSDIVIDTVSSLARKNSIRIRSIDSQAVRDKKIYQELPIRLNITANYHRLGHFISDLENIGMLEVENLKVETWQKFYTDSPIEDSIVLEFIAFSLKERKQ